MRPISSNENFNMTSVATAAIDFPRGSYLVRVEAYRPNQALHYSYHQKKIFIDR